jgi:predicted acyl esterase
MSRSKEEIFYLWPDHRLSPGSDPPPYRYVSNPDIMLGTAALETSSWGSSSDPDLPADEAADDHRSSYLDSDPLPRDLECFGYPMVTLNLECDKPRCVLAARLCEVSPETSASHLVTYRFFNLCYRGGDFAEPQPVPPEPFEIRIPLNITGHIFKSGWKLRLSISPFLFPTLWQSTEIPTLKVRTGSMDGLSKSALSLPLRAPRPDDLRVQKLLGKSRTTYVNPELYVPTTEKRPSKNTRSAEIVMSGGKKATLVKKVFDSGATVLGGALGDILFDQIYEEKVEIIDAEPLSAKFSAGTMSILSRGDWKARAVNEARMWSEKTATGEVVFRYDAHARAFDGDHLLEEKHVEGAIPRQWI